MWRLEFNMHTVSRGLGLFDTNVRLRFILLSLRCALAWRPPRSLTAQPLAPLYPIRTHPRVHIPACPQFGVFPSFILIAFSRLLTSGLGGKTLYVQSNPGLNMSKLEDLDQLSRKIASYATNSPSPFMARAR